MYDAIVAGGSISGLLAAREIAGNGHSVLVLEEGFEVGSPEHCGGLVSRNALKELGIEPSQKTFDDEIKCAKIFSPEGKEITINSEKQKSIIMGSILPDINATVVSEDLIDTLMPTRHDPAKLANAIIPPA